MLKVQLSVPELKREVMAVRALTSDPVGALQRLAGDVRAGFEGFVNDLLDAELTMHLGREPYERVSGPANHRNGYRSRRFTLKGVGTIDLRIPRDRDGTYQTELVPKRIQYDPAIEQDLQMLFLGGASTRTVELMSERLFGRRLSAGEVSQATKKLLEPVEAWRKRPLDSEKYLYLFVDGTYFSMRRGNEVEKQCVLVVVGVTEDRQRRVLALQAGDRESSKSWAVVFQELIQRGLDPSAVQLGVMDGLPGLEKAFKAAFRKAAVQRCQFHKAGNVLAKVRKKDRLAVAEDMRRFFYAGDEKSAKAALARFGGRWRSIYPDAVACLEKDADALIAFLQFPEAEWMSLRTTNVVERVNKEFKRRTRPMEIVAGEASVYRILAFVAIKMESSWRKAPFRNSGFRKLKPFSGYFTHAA